MKNKLLIWLAGIIFLLSFGKTNVPNSYKLIYSRDLIELNNSLNKYKDVLMAPDLSVDNEKPRLKSLIHEARMVLKKTDFWLRYFEPVAYNRINGPLPVEWENEVFEKFEKPYRRIGGGLSLAELYLDNPNPERDTLVALIQRAMDAIPVFQADSITGQLEQYHHFFLANRLYLLNLAAVYTTGFECPDPDRVIPELKKMIADNLEIYSAYNSSFPDHPLTRQYLDLYQAMLKYVNTQSGFQEFNRYTFIKEYVNPLFALNQKLIVSYKVISTNYNDYTLNNDPTSIFDKGLYQPQNTKGIYSLVKDEEAVKEIKHIGKLLFYDPILSGNNQRSCVSCHRSTQYFTDTVASTSLQFNGIERLPRNTPSLVDVIFNHLIMLDGRHITLQNQCKDVMTNPKEMGGHADEIFEKVMSCREYKNAFTRLLKYVPEEKEVTLDHIVSAITYYYGEFSTYYAPFDEAMNHDKPLDAACIKGFNLFMGKAQCGTCHYVPEFNGVKPPYISSEFEVIGAPIDKSYTRVSPDSGRFNANPAPETVMAFRTGSLRNALYTKPYMHNGVFTTLEEVVEFYNAGGGAGHKLNVPNQTLASDSLNLSATEKKELISFLYALNEDVKFQLPPEKLPLSAHKELNTRKVGGTY